MLMSRAEPRGVRSFLAVLLPEGVRATLHEATADLRRRAPRVAWVRVENLHVTLRFLGELEESALARVRAALEAVTAAAPFQVTLGGLGGFPGPRAPRVVWAGVVVGGAGLIALHARLEAALAQRGIPPEGRAFHPHVTLGRARSPRGEPELAHMLRPGAGPSGKGPFGETVVDAVHLMRSDLGPDGARYAVLMTRPLALGRSAVR